MKRLTRRDFVKWSAVSATALTASSLVQGGKAKGSSTEVNDQQKQIAMLLFPGMTALDLIAPQMIFALLPERQVHLVAKTLAPVQTDTGVMLQPRLTLEDTPDALEVLFVPGGLVGTGDAMRDRETLKFLESRAVRSSFVTSVCTGSLILGAAGLLRGYKATTHWSAREVLPLLGAELVKERVVEDRNRVTAGGITSGLDFALRLAAKLENDSLAKTLQLMVEYAPAAPFLSGTPELAEPGIVASVEQSELFKPYIASWFEAARMVQ